eukprot:6262831-Prymnesium_polylepis.1
MARVVALDGLHRGVGGDLHVRWAEQRRAGVAPRNRDNGREHEVLDERTRNDDLGRAPDATENRGGDLVGRLQARRRLGRRVGSTRDVGAEGAPRRLGL